MARGLQPANYPVANALTLTGYPGLVQAGRYQRALREQDAAKAVAYFIDANTIPRNQLAQNQYSMMAGLGDDIDEVTDLLDSGYFDQGTVEPPEQSQDSWWSDILKTFVGPIGLGVAGRIAGQNPWAKPVVIAPGAEGSTLSTPVKIGLAVVGVGAGAYLLTRLAKRR